MVVHRRSHLDAEYELSVLALSSRFDGLAAPTVPAHPSRTFSTRSVESF